MSWSDIAMADHVGDGEDPARAYLHAALFHAGDDEFATSVTDFLVEGLSLDEPVAAIVRPSRAELLRDALAEDAEYVTFVDMAQVGSNPSRLISAWADLATEHRRPGRRLRGVGEPVWPERPADELVECHHHESLLNVATRELRGLTLACPYDTAALPEAEIEEARRTHPLVVAGDKAERSLTYHGDDVPPVLADPLPEPAQPYEELSFDKSDVGLVPAFVDASARLAGLDDRRTRDLVVAVGEAAINSVVHGGGRGVIRWWFEEGRLVHEVRDGGFLEGMLVGRRRPSGTGDDGWGLWLIHELCDLVQLRSSDDGTVVRMHIRRG